MEKRDSVKLRVEDIWLNFGGVSALSEVSFDVREVEKEAGDLEGEEEKVYE